MKLCICCSSHSDIPKKIYQESQDLLKEALKKNDLVFGTSTEGLMGLAYTIAKENQKKVIGICPKGYAYMYSKLNCEEEIITNEMLDSTMKMIQASDAILVLPGGFGTVYELFTAIQSKICEEHNLPIILYNINGYYNQIIEFIDKMYEQNFAKESKNFLVATTKKEVLEILTKIEK